MIPYKSPLATAVPQNPEVRREILKAAQRLASESDLVRGRREEITSIQNELELIWQDIAGLLRNGRSLILFELRKYGYNPGEPRVPAGNPDGGRWTNIAASDDPNEASDAPDPSIPFQKYAVGHHWVTRKIFEKRNFSEEVKVFFDKAKSGALADPRVNYNTTEHRAYNDAVNKLLDEFLNRNNIAENQMTLTQAEEFLQNVKSSTNPVIRGFVNKINREVLRYNLRYGPARRGFGDEE